MKLRCLAFAALTILCGCDALKADTSTLWSTSSAPANRPRCDACHGFAPRTGGHRYHLDTMQTYSGDRHITCMDCHAASIAFAKSTTMDTMFFDADPMAMTKHTANYPWQDFIRPDMQDPATQFEMIPTDSVPLAWTTREPGAENPFWITADAKLPGLPGHANGQVDVGFAERNANFTDDDGGVHKASWNPVRLSCNAVACHGSDALDSSKYVWKDVVRQ